MLAKLLFVVYASVAQGEGNTLLKETWDCGEGGKQATYFSEVGVCHWWLNFFVSYECLDDGTVALSLSSSCDDDAEVLLTSHFNPNQCYQVDEFDSQLLAIYNVSSAFECTTGRSYEEDEFDGENCTGDKLYSYFEVIQDECLNFCYLPSCEVIEGSWRTKHYEDPSRIEVTGYDGADCKEEESLGSYTVFCDTCYYDEDWEQWYSSTCVLGEENPSTTTEAPSPSSTEAPTTTTEGDESVGDDDDDDDDDSRSVFGMGILSVVGILSVALF